jgi:hypothetical protein
VFLDAVLRDSGSKGRNAQLKLTHRQVLVQVKGFLSTQVAKIHFDYVMLGKNYYLLTINFRSEILRALKVEHPIFYLDGDSLEPMNSIVAQARRTKGGGGHSKQHLEEQTYSQSL